MRLTRSENDKMLFGVCGGLAEYFNMDATIIRIIFALATVFTIGSPIIIYIVMALVMPKKYY